MVIYGSKQDLMYYTLRHIYTGTVNDIVIKTSGEYLFYGELSDVVGMVMLGSFDVDDVLEKVENSTEMELASSDNGIFDTVLGNVVNAILLNNIES